MKSTDHPPQYSLLFPWIITSIAILLLCAILLLTQYNNPDFMPAMLPLDTRILWRSLCYIGAILLLPLTNLLRYIFLRLNQTMPPLKPLIDVTTLAQQRYTLTVSVSMAIMLFIGALGAMMFLFGDNVNTLYILTLVAGLGIFLYRPKQNEYLTIVHALTRLKTHHDTER